MDARENERLRQIFFEANQLPEPERAEFVRKACGDDNALRREVETLLSADQELARAPSVDPDGLEVTVSVSGPADEESTHPAPAPRPEYIGPEASLNRLIE